jgi:hypothetical protein
LAANSVFNAGFGGNDFLLVRDFDVDLHITGRDSSRTFRTASRR